jgi:hypothetical protein
VNRTLIHDDVGDAFEALAVHHDPALGALSIGESLSPFFADERRAGATRGERTDLISGFASRRSIDELLEGMPFHPYAGAMGTFRDLLFDEAPA